MISLSALVLAPPVRARLRERYITYRRNGAPPFSAALGCFWLTLAWLFLPLENPRWQAIRAQHALLFPHIHPDPPASARYRALSAPGAVAGGAASLARCRHTALAACFETAGLARAF